MLPRLVPLVASSWCHTAACALHTSGAAAQAAEAVLAQQPSVQDAIDALRKRMAQGKPHA